MPPTQHQDSPRSARPGGSPDGPGHQGHHRGQPVPAEASHWDRRYAQSPWSTEPDSHLVGRVAGLAPGRALDLGCGLGRNAVWLAAQGWEVTGVDGSAVGLDQAAQRAAEAGTTLRLVQADLLAYRPEPAAYDLVVLANLHFPPGQREALFEHARAALAPGGHVFVTGHHLASLGREGPPFPERLYTEALMAALLEPLGAEVVRVDKPGDDGPLVDVVAWAGAPGTGEVPA